MVGRSRFEIEFFLSCVPDYYEVVQGFVETLISFEFWFSSHNKSM